MPGHPACGLGHVSATGPEDTVLSMSVESEVMVGLMAFVILAPTLMVTVLVSGMSRRGPETSDETGSDLG